MNHTVALLTDFGYHDNYVGVMKGVILSINPKASFVDLCHEIPPQDILRGALILKNAYRYLPKKTTFLAVVDPGVGSKRNPMILQTRDYCFVGPDNGIFSPIQNQERQTQIFTITASQYFLKPISSTFHGRDIFAPVAGYLSLGLAPDTFGPRQKSMVSLNLPMARVDKKRKEILGQVIDIDRFGNLLTNLQAQDIEKIKGQFTVQIGRKKIMGLSRSYGEVSQGEILAIIGSHGTLEIAVNQGSARRRLGVSTGEPIRILFD